MKPLLLVLSLLALSLSVLSAIPTASAADCVINDPNITCIPVLQLPNTSCSTGDLFYFCWTWFPQETSCQDPASLSGTTVRSDCPHWAFSFTA